MLYEKLKKHASDGAYPMHMPGHKRNTNLLPPGLPYDIDVTEIHGFDDLHDPQGVLKETAELAACLYGSERAFPLVNGSTVGVLAAIGAHTVRGDKLLTTRNCHRSVCNAAGLFGLNTVYTELETDETSGIACSVEPAAVEAALRNDPDIKLVAVTSPTYEGVISDIGSISEITHRHGIPLFVDGAHGAHLDFSPAFRGGAVRAGADIVVMSLHKTLPALTQCSLLHTCGGYANVREITRLLSVLQTSSPSYVLMASIDHCLRMISSGKEKLFSEYEQNLDLFDADIKPLKKLSVLCHGGDAPHAGFFSFDPGKLVVVTKKTALSGMVLADILRAEFMVELELACPGYAVAMTSICDTAASLRKLAGALCVIDRRL